MAICHHYLSNLKAEYPFKPPKISFKTRIYHPNVDEKGQVCLPIVAAENWKPATKTDQVRIREFLLSNDLNEIKYLSLVRLVRLRDHP